MTLVAGVDSSTQSCKVIVHDAETGAVVRHGSAPHPDGTEVDPRHWWQALQQAVDAAGGLDEVGAVAVGGQQHGMVCLDELGGVVRDALLWNDTRSAAAAEELIAELPGGAKGWADAVGTVPVASITATKLRWMATHEPANADRTAAVCLPHDWLTWRLRGTGDLADLTTDRSEASGTGYWSTPHGVYRADLLDMAFGRSPLLPRVLAPDESAGSFEGRPLGAGAGDNAGAALGIGASAGDVVVSIGTSGVVSAVSDTATTDPSGTVAGFADATGRYLPMAVTLNASRVLSAMAELLGVDLDRLSDLALSAPSGADGLVVVPYLEGERTPNRPDSTGAIHGLTLRSSTPAHLARAAVEGMLCGLADGLDALIGQGVEVRRVLLVGGGARSVAVRELAPALLGVPVVVPEPGEYVARGAARQAAWVLAGSAEPPEWPNGAGPAREAEPTPSVRERYAEACELTVSRFMTC